MRPALITRRSLAVAVLAGLAALAAPGTARAAFVAADSKVSITSIAPSFGSGGSYTGTIEVDNNTTTSSSVRITLTNTSASHYLTAFGFSLPNTLTSGALVTKPTSNWQLLADGNYSNGSMFDTGSFGQFDIGAAIGSTWHVGGTSTNGLAAGQTGTFVFDLVGSGANVTASALMSYLSTNNSAGIGVRFRPAGSTSTADGSKVLAKIVTTPPPPPPPPPTGAVPAPPALLLGLVGIGGLLGRGAFRRKAAPTV